MTHKVGLTNKKAYESGKIVQAYCSSSDLQEPEKAVISILNDNLKDMRMLDIGIGGGRTTTHFAPLVQSYTGIDFAENMVRACREKFADCHDKISFHVADVRDMHVFEDQSFDFILFSYNGIDYVSHEERVCAFKEIQRVGMRGGLFFFSTHNLLCVDHLLAVPFCKNPLRLYALMKRHLHVKKVIAKRKMSQHDPYVMIQDGGEEFKVKTHYIEPLEQLKQLHLLGFKNIRVFSENTGQEIKDITDFKQYRDDRWLYFLNKM